MVMSGGCAVCGGGTGGGVVEKDYGNGIVKIVDILLLRVACSQAREKSIFVILEKTDDR